ncbi:MULTISPECIES: ABC transporter substrate-binding protein [unclassified Rhizobium]|uniref:ABC transporter substrate-binding protein n=1 Tax=unclassified Rhizobium TaxID=2613769 RepID=UPI00247A4C03|nr:MULTISPECIES: ABC transporter substrate-binding protein [unclassified Rhizobium]
MSYIRELSKIALFAATAFLAVDVPASRAGGTFNIGLESDVGVLDPHVACGYLAKLVNYQIFEGLVEVDLTNPAAPAQIKGQLAERWEISEDGKLYTFHLRQGVTFHDGTNFDAAAVKFNFDRFLDATAPQYSENAAAFFGQIGYTKSIESVDVVDSSTITIRLREPNYQFLRMGMEDCPQMYFISPKAIQEYGDEGLPLHPVGTGPFVFISRENGISIDIKKNASYWGATAKLDEVVFRVLEDPSTRVNALRSGEVQLIRKPNWDELPYLEEEGFVIAENRNAPNFTYASLNMKSPTFADPRVRLAVNHAINRVGIVEEILGGHGAPAYSMINPGNAAFDSEYAPYDYDPAKAKALLAEAGYTDGDIKLNVDIPQVGDGELVEKWVQRDLRAIGIEVSLNRIEWLAYLNKWNGGMPAGVDANTQTWGQMTPQWTAMTYSCGMQPPNGWNVGWYCNPEADRLFALAVATRDEGEAAKLYQQATRIIMERDAPHVPIYADFNPVAMTPDVVGFINPAANWYDLSIVDLK